MGFKCYGARDSGFRAQGMADTVATSASGITMHGQQDFGGKQTLPQARVQITSVRSFRDFVSHDCYPNIRFRVVE